MSKYSHKKSRKHDSLNTRKNHFYSQTLIPNENGCMEWIGSKNGSGYGQMSVPFRRSPILASHFSYMVHNGKFDKSLWVLHTCDNPKCVSPDHLFLGNRSANMKDCANKGRLNIQREGFSSGENNSQRKLSSRSVNIIRQFLRQNIPIKEIAKEYDLNYSTISNIKNKKSWRSLNERTI